MVQIDLNGKYPDTVHLPTFLAWSEPAQKAVFLLLDTGHDGGGSVCGFTEQSTLQNFMGTDNSPTVRLGPFTALQPPPNSVTHGELLDQPHISHENLARQMRLSAKKAHVDGVTTSYLLGPLQDNQYPERLVAFWSTGSSKCSVEDQATARRLKHIFGHEVTFYTTAITQLSPGDPGIPAPGNEIALKVVVVKSIPRAVAQGPGGTLFSCVVDTGASYNVVRREVAQAYNLECETDANIVLPKLEFPKAEPALSLLNVPAVVDNAFPRSDPIILGGIVLDRFSTVVLDFGTGVGEEDPVLKKYGYECRGVSGVIRLIR